MDVNFKFTENKRFEFGEADEISLEILGQEFKEIFQIDKRSILGYDRERARLFGMRLQEIGLMIQTQAEKGKTQDIIFCKGGINERVLHCF